jgi:nucleotide-binding universal stress UspA family protein
VFSNILVPLDGSTLSERALPYAEFLAHTSHATLTLVRNAHSPFKLFGDAGTEERRAISQAEAYLEELRVQLSDRGLTVHTGVPFDGSAAGWITEEIALRRADLVIMATHDRVGPDRWVHGSVAEAVVNHASVPVMLVRGDAAAPRFFESNPTVIVPLDGSEFAEAALPFAMSFARVFGAHLVLLRVVVDVEQLAVVEGGTAVPMGRDLKRLTASNQAYLEAVAARVSAPEVEVAHRQGEPAAEIVYAARERSAALVIMATHGRTGALRSVLGSVAGGVLHHGPTPVMLVRPSELRPAEQPVQQAAVPAI